MSASDAVSIIKRYVSQRIEAAAPFRAVVTAVSGSLITIRRVGTTSADTLAYASCPRFSLAVNDEVLCVMLGKQPVIIERIGRTATLASTGVFTVNDNDMTILDNLDTTKKAQFQASGITAATTRTYTLPNASGGLGLINKGYFTPPGPGIVDAVQVTALTTGLCGARYLGMTPFDVTSIEINVRVTTAVATITWAEAALASGTAAGANLTLLGSATDVSATWNSTGVKVVTFAFTIPANTFVYLLFASTATTPFQLRATIADELNIGFVRSATARPSTMAAPTSFSASSAITAAAYVAVRWS